MELPKRSNPYEPIAEEPSDTVDDFYSSVSNKEVFEEPDEPQSKFVA